MQNQEMSMEEILASIRKIISEDKRASDKRGTPSPSTSLADQMGGHTPILSPSPSQSSSASNILELNHKIQEDGSIQVVGNGMINGRAGEHNGTLNGVSSNGSKGRPGLSMPGQPLDSLHGNSVAASSRTRAQAHLPPVPSATSIPRASSARDIPDRASASSERIVGKNDLLMSSETAASSLSALQKVTSERDVSFSTGATLESMVLEMLKPLLRAWLDAHLPSLLERVVREQIQQLVQK